MRAAPFIILLLLFAVLSACSSTPTEPTQAQLRVRWDEQNVFPGNYKADVMAFMGTYLNNPAGIRSAAVSLPVLKRIAGNPGDRYMVCLRYNARKTDGGYAGVKETVATFVSGKFERFIDPQRGDIQQDSALREVRELCRDAAYAPFPELQNLRR